MSILQSITARLQTHTKLTAGPKLDAEATEAMRFLSKKLGTPVKGRPTSDENYGDRRSGGELVWIHPLAGYKDQLVVTLEAASSEFGYSMTDGLQIHVYLSTTPNRRSSWALCAAGMGRDWKATLADLKSELRNMVSPELNKDISKQIGL